MHLDEHYSIVELERSLVLPDPSSHALVFPNSKVQQRSCVAAAKLAQRSAPLRSELGLGGDMWSSKKESSEDEKSERKRQSDLFPTSDGLHPSSNGLQPTSWKKKQERNTVPMEGTTRNITQHGHVK